MTEQSTTPVASIAVTGLLEHAGGGFVTLTCTTTTGQIIELQVAKELAEQLLRELQTVMAVDQSQARRRYHDIKPGSLRGS